MIISDRTFEFVTVDVFTDRRFGGNPLAVFPNAAGLTNVEMQAIANELNLSETSFVFPPANPANTAGVRIFNRTAEMPFAGHPNVGTGYVLASRNETLGDVLRFEELAGLVEVRVERTGDGQPTAAEIDAPQKLQILQEFSVPGIAACASLDVGDFRISSHVPVKATVGVDFVLAEVKIDALSRAAPDLAAFQRLAAATQQDGDRLSLLIYGRDGDIVRSRMFAPLSGTWEDAATGSANATLGALLLSLSSNRSLALDVQQGIEMNRPSRLTVTARRSSDGIFASVGGKCVPVFTGKLML